MPAPIFARAAVAADFGFLVGSTTSVDINLVLKSVSVSGGLEHSPLSGFLFSSESGTVYNIPGGTAIPEPSSIYLLSAGTFILVSRHAAKYVLRRLIEDDTPDVCASLHQRTNGRVSRRAANSAVHSGFLNSEQPPELLGSRACRSIDTWLCAHSR